MITPARYDGPRNPGHDFPEDFHQENGQYLNACIRCNQAFVGNKHRIVCKACITPPRDA
jgi:hypothetical protein